MVMLGKSRAQGTELWQTYATWSYRENGLCLFPPPSSALQSQLVSLEQTCGLPYSMQTLQEQKEERVANCPFADKSQLPVSPGTLSCQRRLQAGRGRQTRQEGKGVPLKYSRGEKAVKGTKTELFSFTYSFILKSVYHILLCPRHCAGCWHTAEDKRFKGFALKELKLQQGITLGLCT